MNTPIDSSADEFEDPLSNFEQIKYESELERILAEDPVSGMQTQPCTMVDPSLPVHAALKVLSEANVSSVLVVDNGRLVGIFTERDVLDRVADSYEELKPSPVSDVMTSDPLVIYAGDPSSAALAAIVVAGYRHVPVLNGNDIVGVVSPERVFGFIDGRS